MPWGMGDTRRLSIFTHAENLPAVGVGDGCLVRWESDGRKLWYYCTVAKLIDGGCMVNHRGTIYEINWELDEVLTKPAHAAVQYVTMYPECVCIEVDDMRYLVPSEDINFGDIMGDINVLRARRSQKATFTDARWSKVSIGAVAAQTATKKVTFANQ